jgi:hypothetical protein
MPVALSSLKVELVLDQGATQLLGEWAAAAGAPVADAVLQPGGQRVLSVRFDVRELGVCSLSCSAVFRGEGGGTTEPALCRCACAFVFVPPQIPPNQAAHTLPQLSPPLPTDPTQTQSPAARPSSRSASTS